MIIVSACLAGYKCRYDGKTKPNSKVIDIVKKGKAIPVCPEQLGGLPTPRTPAEQINDKVITKTGEDVTIFFEKGAEEVLKIAQEHKSTKAILKARSPSCGSGLVYDGSFSGRLIKGDGVTAKLLKQNNIDVKTEEEI